jgi:hypothetical protein
LLCCLGAFVVDQLIQNVTKVDLQQRSHYLKDPVYGGWSPLTFQIWRLNVEMLSFLIEVNVEFDVNQLLPNQFTPITYAIFKGDVNMFEYLMVQDEIDLEREDGNESTPLTFAVNMNQTAMVGQMMYGVMRWAGTLPMARVTQWGRMIPTPDTELQSSIKHALRASGCPGYIVTELMENAHERRWPQGLKTMEIRHMNRKRYQQYFCKRIPGQQAVVVMACDNVRIWNDMVLDPGLVIIFENGVE